MTFEIELKNAISRQNQNVCNLLEQYDELKEIIEKHYINKEEVKFYILEHWGCCGCGLCKDDKTAVKELGL